MQILLLLIVGLVPLAITPGFLVSFDVTPKIIILLSCVALMIVFCKQNVNNIGKLMRSTTGRWFLGLITAQWIASIVTVIFSTDQPLSFHGSLWRRYGLITETAILLLAILAAAWFSGEPNHVRNTLRILVAAGTITALYGISQYFGLDPLLPTQGYESGEGPFAIVRPPGTLGHADYFASWLLMIVFFCLELARIEEQSSAKTVARIAAAISTIAIVLSGTRSALLGLLIGLIIVFLTRKQRISRNSIIAAAAASVCFAIFFLSPAGLKLRARLHWSIDDARGGARLLLWRDSLRMSAQKPIAGFGPETFTRQFPQYQSRDLARAYPDFYQESPHNIFLDALASRGIIGLFPLLGLCALGLMAAWCAKNAYLGSGLVAIIVGHQFTVFIASTVMTFYLLLAILISEPDTSEAPPLPWWTWIPRIAFALLLLIFALHLFAAGRFDAIAQARIGEGKPKEAAAAYNIVRAWQPRGASTELFYSQSMTRLAATTSDFSVSVQAAQQALESGIRATSSAEDRQNAWYNLAMLAARRDDSRAVESSLRNAIACAPNWFKPHWALAQLLLLTGRHDEARIESALAVDLDGGHDAEVRLIP